jgi:hypothetical protein
MAAAHQGIPRSLGIAGRRRARSPNEIATSSGIVAVGEQVFVSNWTDGQILRVAPSVEMFDTKLRCAAGMSYAAGLGLLVADFESDTIYRVAL